MTSERKKQYRKEWWSKNREKLNEKRKRYYYRHKEEVLANMKAKYEARKQDPEYMAKLREYKRNHQKARNAKKREEIADRPRSDMCESCGEIGKVVYDHNHDTGEFRGWLCQGCNKALGFLRDNPAYIRALEGYVVKDFMRKHYKKLGVEVEFSSIPYRVRQRQNIAKSYSHPQSPC